MADILDEKLVEKIKDKMREKESAELREIYDAQDMTRWSPEAFAAIRQVLEERGEPFAHIPPKAPSLEDKILLAERSKSRGGCMRVFLFVSGPVTFSRGVYSVSLAHGFWETAISLLVCILGLGLVYIGIKLRAMARRHPKVIYTLVLTYAVSALGYVGVRFDFGLTTLDIVTALILLAISWAIFRSAAEFRLFLLLDDGDTAGADRQMRVNRLTGKAFLGAAAVIALLGFFRISLFPLSANDRAEYLLIQGRVRSALEEFEQILAKAPDDKEARFGALICLLRMNRYEEARNHLDQAWAIAAADPLYRIQLVRVVNHTWQNFPLALHLLEQLKESRNSLSKGLTDFDRMFYGNLGWVQLHMDLQEARKSFAKARPLWDQYINADSRSDETPEIHLYYGIFYVLEGNASQAAVHFEAVDGHPLFPVIETLAREELKNLKNRATPEAAH